MRQLLVLSIVFFSFFIANAQNKTITKIAFGSCAEEFKPQPVLDLVVKHKPDYFIYLGDNIYGDSDDMDTLRMKYLRLQVKPEFQRLIHQTKVLATWDDHDYGYNDGGKEFSKKLESKQLFLDFFKEPANSERRKQEGIYTSYMYNVNGKKLQIILLDGRTFRDPLKKYDGEFKKDKRYFYDLEYAPHTDTTQTLLGTEQWRWLEGELKKKADIRIIGSGSQFSIEYDGYEAWANFPHEQKKMLDLIKKTKANGVMFITGDVHYAEISKLNSPSMYPIYDVTASGITSTWKFAAPNVNRIEGPVMENHFGMLTIDWAKKDPSIKMEIIDVSDNQRIEYTIGLSEINFNSKVKSKNSK
jgi:alkaline phosphatase D